MASSKWLLWFERGWRWLLHAGFLLLCLRFLVAATRETYPDVLPMLVLTAGGLGLSVWRPGAALFAFTASVPLLNGLGYVGLAGCPSPLSVVFSAIFLGFSLKEAQKGANELWRGRQDEFGRKKAQEAQREEAQGADPEVTGQGQRAESGGTDSRSCRATEAGEPSVLSDRWTVVTVERYPTVQLAADVLITVVLASLVMQIARHHDATGFWTPFCRQPVFSYGDPLYFMTSAFVWLQGLFFFRMLSAKGTEERGNEGARDKGEEQGALSKERSAGGEAVSAWAKPVFVVYGCTLAAFYLFQLCLHIPEPIDTTTYCSPLEDIHSFGSIAVAVFAFAIASWRRQSWARTLIYGIGVIALLTLVVASYSRATWLAGALVLLLVAWIRLPKKWTAALVGLGVIAVVIINANAGRETWNRNPYLWRLISLARVENLANKSPDRFNLYYKTVGMIREHPFVGHGIGSIYLTSVRFARPGDPYADIPNFTHNFLLQMAAELGVPAAALFAALIGCALHRGYRRWKIEDRRANAEAIRSPVSGIRYHEHAMLGVTMALVAYLITQMTANALNIYISNQFFFWFLMAAVLSFNTESAEAE